MFRPKAITVLSGGLDSTVATANCQGKYDIQALTFDYGQRFRRNPLVGACIGVSGPVLLGMAILFRMPLLTPMVAEVIVCWLVACWLIAAASLSTTLGNLRVDHYPRRNAARIAVALDVATLGTLLAVLGLMMSELLGAL